MLEFDPFSPNAHTCGACGRVYRGELHDRWWIYPYQLWLAERAVHAALLGLLRGESRHIALAQSILRAYADRYATYPNRDNVLGPTHLFFSTYLESIWLLQICVAADCIAASGDRATAELVRERIVAPSAALIEQYDEGHSNRQVWNNAALMAASLLRGDRARAERIVRAPSGVESHLRYCVLSDGTWYEGENYHQFAHRGLWYCITMAERAGIPIAPDLIAKFTEGFAAPFASALPDLTFPARKDSQYAASLRQWRFAESCELGLVRGDDVRLRAALARLYAADIPRRDTGRARSSAEAERNVPASSLTRADLGWRSLLLARPELPPLAQATPRSAHLTGQGFTVFRREAGDVYVALDWGQSGGGHGHPDRLNVLFAHDGARWLDDLGTGSYVDPSLHWYRSTLAHNAPLVNGSSQRRVPGKLIAYDERGGVGWIRAQVHELAPGVDVQRTLVVTPDYFIDDVRWTADSVVRFELPVHFEGEAPGLTFVGTKLDGGDGTEDGFSFVLNAAVAGLGPNHVVELAASHDGHTARAFVNASRGARLFRALAPGQPASVAQPFYVVRCEGSGGVIRTVWAWGTRVSAVAMTEEHIDVRLDAERHVHRETDEYWQMEMTVGAAHSGIELFGWVTPEDEKTRRREDETPVVVHAMPLVTELAEKHYRRSEESWAEAGTPRAQVNVSADGDELVVHIDAAVGPLVLVPRDAVNPYDNEQPDINGHGVQLYVATSSNGGAWVVVPERDSNNARARRLSEWGSLELRAAECTLRESGFAMTLRVAIPNDAETIALDVIVNETAPGRARRRGQLVLSGSNDEFVYLRGDRHDPARLLPLKR
jgi:hypothetical protein